MHTLTKNNENKYLIFASTDKNKEALENYTELWDKIKDQIEVIGVNKPIKYKKYFMKIKSESDDDLPLGKILNIPVFNNCRICFSRKQQQVFLHECFYEYEYDYEDDCYVICMNDNF